MVVPFSPAHEGKEGAFLSPLIVEEGRGRGGRGRDNAMPASPSKMSFLEYYQQMNLDRYLQAERRQATGGCMASAWRVISFFLVVFVLPTVLISLPLYARYHLYHTRHLAMTETDTRALNDAVNSFWCQGQRVSINGSLDAYLVSGSPKMKEERRHVKLRRKLVLKHDDIEYWGVYLLQGSTFTVSSTARWPGGVLLVAKGEENLRKCFYREDHLEAELNDIPAKAPPRNIYRSPPDVDDLTDDTLMGEERHTDDTGGGEVFDADDDDVDNLDVDKLGQGKDRESGDKMDRDGSDKVEHVDEHEPEDSNVDDLDEIDSFIPHRKLNLKNKRPEVLKRRNRKGKKGSKKGNRKNRRNRNEAVNERSKRDTVGSISSSPSDALPPISPSKLDMLHHFNDTLVVTTGNSSFSSSEEFLEQCRDSLLVVELQPSLDWEWRIDTDTVGESSTWMIPVDTTDYYYFIFTSDNSIEENHLGFVLEMERVTYDVTEPLMTCRNASECVFPLTFAQTESVVVEVPGEENLDELHSYEVITACQPRVPVYMVFILLVPFIILLFAFQ